MKIDHRIRLSSQTPSAHPGLRGAEQRLLRSRLAAGQVPWHRPPARASISSARTPVIGLSSHNCGVLRLLA